MAALGVMKIKVAGEYSPHCGWSFGDIPINTLGLHTAPLPLHRHIINPTPLDNTPEEKA
jgi:hypothetical protein